MKSINKSFSTNGTKARRKRFSREERWGVGRKDMKKHRETA